MRQWTWLLVGGWLSTAILAAYPQGPVAVPQVLMPAGQIQVKAFAPAVAQPAAPAAADALPERALARLGTPRYRGPGGMVPHTLIYSPDAKLLASADSRSVHLWDAATGRELHQFTNLSGGVPAGVIFPVGMATTGTIGNNALAFAQDSKTLAVSVSYSTCQVHMFDVATGREVADWPTNLSGTVPLAYTPDGKHLAGLSSLDQAMRRPTVAFWEPATGQQVRQFQIGEPSNSSSNAWLAFAPDGRSLAAATYGRPIIIAETTTGQARAEWALTRIGGSPMATSIVFALDGRTLFSVTPDGTIAAWDMAAGRERRRFGLATSGSSLSLSADGKLLAVRGSDASLRLYEPSTGRLRQRIADTSVSFAFALAPDGTTLASYGSFGGLRFWDTASGRERSPPEGHAGPVTHLTFAADGRTLVSTSAERVCVWDLATRKQQTAFDEAASSARLRVLSPDGRRQAVVGATSSVRVVEFPGGKVVRQLDDIAGGPYGLAFNADGGTLAVSEGKVVKLWDLANGTAKRTIEAGAGAVSLVALSPDGRRLAGLGGFGGVQVWDADTGRSLWEQAGAAAGRAAPVFAPDGRQLAVASADGPVHVYDAATGRELATLEGRSGSTPALAFSPDGRLLATGDIDRQVHIWEIAGSRLLHVLSGHQGAIESLLYSPDGRLLASGGSDAIVLLWDATRLGTQPDTAPPEPELTDAQMAKLWDDLASTEAAKAYAAMKTLAASPRATVAQVRSRLKPAEIVDPQKLAQLLADLDSARFDRREKASRELSALADGARPALEKFIADATSTEARLRAQELMKAVDQPANSAEALRQMRTLEVLEWAGTPEARAALADLAKGADGARLTRDARMALERMQKQG